MLLDVPGQPVALKALSAALFKSGRVSESIEPLQAVLQVQPKDAEALNNLGIAFKIVGRLEEAKQSLQQAILLQPGYAEAYNNLGNVYSQAGEIEVALANYRQAIALKADYADAYSNLASALGKSGQLAEAAAAYGLAIRYRPDNQAAYLNLGIVFKQLGRLDDAEASCRKAIELTPGSAEAHNNLGVVLKEVGRLRQAEASFRRALDCDQSYADAHSNLGGLLNDLGRLEEAEVVCRQAIALNPTHAEAHSNLANVLADLWRLDDAVASCRLANALNPNSAVLLSNLGVIYADSGKLEEAEASYRQALAIDERNSTARAGLGRLQVAEGKFTDAEATFYTALKFDPSAAAVWAEMATLRKMTKDDLPWLERAKHLVQDSKQKPSAIIALLYAMGKFCDDVKEYGQAFAYYQQANTLRKQRTARYDATYEEQLTSHFIEIYSQDYISKQRVGASKSELPLFIVGMPRSGTSLLEQIIASHPATFGAGELVYWGDTAKLHQQSVLTGDYAADELSFLASEYLNQISQLDQHADRIVDKMPGNYKYLGMIHAALPNARILHASRNPVDTCLSIYFQNFNPGHKYANDLDDLAHYYRQYHRLMEHWRSVLPQDIFLDVPYEKVVEDQVGWSRKVIEFIGLDWDGRCLEFHKTERRVATASNWQARQPIYKTSKERWRNYAQFVSPLLPLLEL